jgi:GT2 family glycosyltransferase
MTISIISACKNRGKALSISLASWIQFDEVDEIIITDWNSDEPIDHLTCLDSRIKVITVPNEPYFNQPQPLNLAASLVESEYILKLDSDTVMNPYFNFFHNHTIDNQSFLTGITEQNLNIFHNEVVSKSEKNPFLVPLWGTLYITKENYLKVGGYNENINTYAAWEDNELVERLLLLGLDHKKIKFNLKTLFSLPHSSKERVQNFKAYDEDKNLNLSIKSHVNEVHNIDDDNIIHRLILEKHNRINWKKYKLIENSSYHVNSVVKWGIEQVTSQHYVAQKIPNK